MTIAKQRKRQIARAKPRGEWVDRAERREVEMRAFAMISETDAAEVKLSDLSYEGCQIESDRLFVPGEKVELRVVRLGAIEAEVRWAYPGRAGAKFSPAQV